VSVPRCVEILAELIGFPTQNPTGDEVALCERLAALLDERGADRAVVVEVPRDAGRSGYVYAQFGEPRLLVNVHIDTVPPNTGWTRDPHRAEVTDDRVIGLGSADTKGAIACVLCALETARPDGVGVLFSGDEELGTTVVPVFLASERAAGIERAIVCEPTGRAAGVRHRGVGAYRASYRGLGGHSSGADHMPKPIVTMAQLAIELDAMSRRWLSEGPDDMKGLCTNVASLDGGVAFNVVPDAASLTWSVRPPPGFDAARFAAEQADAARRVDPAIAVEQVLEHKPFETRDVEPFRALLGERVSGFVGLQFWTEAAVLSEAGIDAVVLGPGSIEQAHSADEWVSVDDLAWAEELFTHVFASTRG